MKKSVVSIDPSGDVCARSSKAALSDEVQADPEHDFELELIAALEENEAAAAAADTSR